MSFFLRSKNLDFSTGDRPVAVLNEAEAESYGLNPGDKIELKWSNKKKAVVTVDYTSSKVRTGYIGLFKEIWKKRRVDAGDIVEVSLVSRPLSIKTLQKKMMGKPATYEEFYSLIKDITEDRLGTIETTYYAASGFVKEYSDMELFYVAKAMAETGEKFNLPYKVVDKHSVGGLAGNRITPLIIPIIASLGIIIPKTSSRAITSPAGTADVMEVLCPVAFEMKEIKKIVRKTSGCLVWGGGVKMAPADDKIIRVSHPLGVESYDKMIVSIMAKKVATGVDYLLIDIPVGETMKVPNMRDAKKIARKFEFLAKKFKMKIKVLPSPAKEPIGRGIGPALEARDVLRVLQQHKLRAKDLEKKGARLAGELLELKGYCKKGEGFKIAKEQLKNGQAWQKMNEIIVVQGGKKDLDSEEVVSGARKYEIHATKSGKISFVNNKAVKEICVNLGAPLEKIAGINIHVRYGQQIRKGDKLYTMYAPTEDRIKLGIIASNKNKIFTIK